MKEQEYKDGLKQLEKEYAENKKQLAIKYAMSNNPFNIGDIFTDYIGSIRIDKIGTYIGGGLPECMYHGVELKKDGTPTKKALRRTGYQSNQVK